eukprot:6468402-Alexandrium_andersonii.AAC.1
MPSGTGRPPHRRTTSANAQYTRPGRPRVGNCAFHPTACLRRAQLRMAKKGRRASDKAKSP